MSVPALIEQPNPAASGQGTTDSQQPGANAVERSDSAPTPASGAASEEPESRGPDFFREAFARLRGGQMQTQSAAPQAPPASTGPVPETERTESQPKPEVPLSAEAPGVQTQQPRPQAKPSTQAPQTDVIQIPQAELDRRIQAEVDRREAKRQRDEQARNAQEEKKRLRTENPWEYARAEEKREADEAAAQVEITRLNNQIVSHTVSYDRAVLDPLVGILPADVRASIISKHEGRPILENRQGIAVDTVNAIKEHFLQEGAKTARTRLLNDQGFIKEVLARYGGGRVEPDSSPSSLPSNVSAPRPTGPEAESSAMNSFMRSSAATLRQTTQ